MKHHPIAIPRIHPMHCQCDQCGPIRTIDGRRLVLTVAAIFLPAFGLLWGVWTILPR